MKLAPSQSLEKLSQAREPQLLCPRRNPLEFQALCPAPADWMREDAEVGPLRLAGTLEELPFSSLEFVGQEERLCSLASLARKKHQSHLD